MVQQDNAKKLKHNQAVFEARKNNLEDNMTFRRPIGGLQQGAFRRGYKASYGEVEKVRDIKGSMVKGDNDEPAIDIKRVMPVDPESSNAAPGFAQGDAWIQRKRDLVFPLILELHHWLGEDEKSMSTAAAHLKKELGEDAYWEYLKSAGFGRHLSQAVSIIPELTLTQNGYYVTRS